MKYIFSKYKNQDGFTIMEIIISMGILSMIVVVIGLFQDQFNRAGLFINQELSNTQGLEQVFQVLTTEIRSASPSSAGAYAIESASSSLFSFFSDVDGDGLVEHVRYYFGTSTLIRGIIKPTGSPLSYATSTETTSTLVTSVLIASSSFQYFGVGYTGSEAALTYPINSSAIRVVRATVTVDVAPSLSPQPTVFSSTITIRNLRSN